MMQGGANVRLTMLESFDFLASDGVAVSAAEALGVPLELKHDTHSVLWTSDVLQQDHDLWVAEANEIRISQSPHGVRRGGNRKVANR